MIKYGLKEFARNIYSNIFIAVQLAIAFIIMSAAVSSVLSRIEMYTPVKKYFPDGKGLYIYVIYMILLLLTVSLKILMMWSR